MQRRDFLAALGVGTAGAVLAGCKPDKKPEAATEGAKKLKLKWKMVTSWPKNFPGLGTAANALAKNIYDLSEGQIEIKVLGAGEMVGALDVFDAVSQGTAQMGHSASYNWKGKVPEAQFFCSVPFGLNANETNAWIYYGGGQKLWNDLYAPYNLVPFIAGNTGSQMAGWFRKEIKSLDDFKNIKMRIPGFGGEVLEKIGATVVNLPGGEIYTALKTGTIDATEFVGPYNDLALGFYQAAKYYYYPAWHEPGSSIELMVNKTEYDALPPHLQKVIEIASVAAGNDNLAEMNYHNAIALDELINKHGVILKKLPDDVYFELRKTTEEVMQDMAKQSKQMQTIYDSFIGFRGKIEKYQEISDLGYLQGRSETSAKLAQLANSKAKK